MVSLFQLFWPTSDHALKLASKNVSPIEILPNEILGEIFALCVDEDLDMQSCLEDSYQCFGYPPPTLDTARSPWVLTYVSIRWRNLAISFPRLWAAFDINWTEDESKNADLPYIKNLIALQLERCGDQPLSISWYQNSCQEHVLGQLCSKASQWTNVTLRLKRSGFEWLFDLRGQFPNITNLHLRFEIDGGRWNSVSRLQEEHGYFYGMFKDASNLRRLTLSGDYEVMPYIVTEFPWNQLTHFTTKNIVTDGTIQESVYGVLPLLQNAETCFLEMAWLEEGPATSFTLPCLHTLVISQDNDTSAKLAEALVTPSLRSLSVILDGSRMGSFQPLLHFIHRSLCRITHLSFDDIRETETPGFLEFLRAKEVQSVRTLAITWNTLAAPGVLAAFHIPLADDTKAILFPNLQSLVVTDEGSDRDIRSSQLVDMLASRRNVDVVSRLESFTIRVDGPEISGFQLEDSDTVTRFEGLQRDGLSYSQIVC